MGLILGRIVGAIILIAVLIWGWNQAARLGWLPGGPVVVAPAPAPGVPVQPAPVQPAPARPAPPADPGAPAPAPTARPAQPTAVPPQATPGTGTTAPDAVPPANTGATSQADPPGVQSVPLGQNIWSGAQLNLAAVNSAADGELLIAHGDTQGTGKCNVRVFGPNTKPAGLSSATWNLVHLRGGNAEQMNQAVENVRQIAARGAGNCTVIR